ncbi:MAG TPA: aminotransferase, partial [Synergistaceae bacterium]|nr:aminotransferase [Synergistaceae bacterium]
MCALWGALKSVLAPGDRLLALSNGIFGRGFGEMGKGLGFETRILEAPEGEFLDPEAVRAEARAFGP